MRINVVQEGVEDPAGRTFLHGSLHSRDRQIAVLMGGHQDAIVGFATDFQVDRSTGWVSYDITFRRDFLEELVGKNESVTDWFDFSGYGINMEQRIVGSKTHIVFGEIAAIYALPKPFPATITKDIPVQTNIDNCPSHWFKQHRDGKPPWCDTCGRASNGDIIKDLHKKAGLGAVTESVDYANIAKTELVKYINKKAEITDGFQINASYLYVVWFSKTLKNWKCLISTSLPDGMYYECTYNGETNQLYIDAYKKFDNASVDL